MFVCRVSTLFDKKIVCLKIMISFNNLFLPRTGYIYCTVCTIPGMILLVVYFEANERYFRFLRLTWYIGGRGFSTPEQECLSLFFVCVCTFSSCSFGGCSTRFGKRKYRANRFLESDKIWPIVSSEMRRTSAFLASIPSSQRRCRRPT